MTDDAVSKARSRLVQTISRTSIGDDDWKIGDYAAELIAERIEDLIEAKAVAAKPPGRVVVSEQTEGVATFVRELPEGFTPAASVASRGQLPPDLKHDTWVEVIYRDGIINKPARSGARVSVGEASLFNWKHAGPGRVIVDGESRPSGMIGNPDDDIIGYRHVAPPENKMAMPKAGAA